MIDGDLKKIIRANIPGAFFQSIETGGTGSGVPDMWGMMPMGITFWIECKKCTTNAVKISPMQVAWHERAARFGVKTYFAIRRKDEFFLFEGAYARVLKEKGLKGGLPLVVGSRGPVNWPWKAIKNALSSRA